MVVAALLVALGVFAVWCRAQKCSSLIAGLIIGIFTAQIGLREEQSLRAADDATFVGTVNGTPRRPNPGEVIFMLATDVGGKAVVLRCRAIDLPWRNAGVLKNGDTIVVRGSLKPVQKPLDPFSWEGWLWRKGVFGEMRARFVSQAFEEHRSLTDHVREEIETLVQNKVGRDAGAALFLSMALGYQDLLSVQLERAFNRLGLTHILIVSGYQVGLMYTFVVSLAGGLLAYIQYASRYLRSTVTLAGLGVAAGYVVCIGAEMSAVRALIAAACLSAHVLSERSSSFAQRWGVALLGIQLIWPWCIFDIGVILTFAALLGIGIGSRLGRSDQFSSFIWINICVWICTTLVVVVWRGNLSPLGLLLNLLVAAPWSIINCTIGLSSLVLVALGMPGGEIPLQAVAWCNRYLAELVLYLGEGSFGGWELDLAARCGVALSLCALVGVALWRASQVGEVASFAGIRKTRDR
jgi:competence protein ComEC